MAATTAVSANVCANEEIVIVTSSTVLGITTKSNNDLGPLCLCLSGGVLTQASNDSITGLVVSPTGLVGTTIATVKSLLGLTNAGLIAQIQTQYTPILAATTNTCAYGAATLGVIPNSCSSCSFKCATGYISCGTTCYPGSTCPSGLTQNFRRNLLLKQESATLCPKNLTPCIIPNRNGAKPVFTGNNYECLDTARDLESCGGCEYPLPNAPKGQDCTAIANTAQVSCQKSLCVIQSCQRDYLFNGTACLPSVALLTRSRTLSFELDPLDSLDSLDLSVESLREGGGPNAKPSDGMSKRDRRDFLAKLQVNAKVLRSGRKSAEKNKKLGRPAKHPLGHKPKRPSI